MNGNKILETGHGLLHGSASWDVKYHLNGAIESAKRTFQSDGGFQHNDATSYFHQDDIFSHEGANSWGRQLTVPDYKHVIIDYPKEEIKK